MEGEGDKIKSKQATERDATLIIASPDLTVLTGIQSFWIGSKNLKSNSLKFSKLQEMFFEKNSDCRFQLLSVPSTMG